MTTTPYYTYAPKPPGWKHAQDLCPGDVVRLAGQVHTVMSRPVPGGTFAWIVHVQLADADGQPVAETLLAHARIPLIAHAGDEPA
jgi:hypothetical protein